MSLEISGLSATYGAGARALHDLDLTVDDEGVTALLGANGAGKTTTLRAISGMVERRGSIVWGGERIDGLRTDQIARRGIGHVPQGRGTLTGLTVEDNLRAGAVMRRDRGAVATDLARAYELFPRLREREKAQAGNLSGGEQQMLAIARALMAAPRLLLLDEPSLGLAPKVTLEVFDAIRRLQADTGIALLVVEQNAQLALELADRVVVLESGSVRASGPVADFADDDTIRLAYLGGLE